MVQKIYAGAYPGKASTDSRAWSCLRMGPLYSGVWKSKKHLFAQATLSSTLEV